MRYCFDIDGTLCQTPFNENGKPDYINAKPFPFMIEQVNRLYDMGNYIILQTARGKSSGIDWTTFTINQLNSWGYKYNELFPMFCKPNADIFIDDKAINAIDWLVQQPQVKGILAGAFDIIHPGYVRLFNECKKYCNHLTIALHENPALERDNKLPPIHTIDERKEILYAIRYIDDVIVYQTEKEFYNYLKSNMYNVRFLGSDYLSSSYTGKDLDMKVIFIDRNHNYSTTKLKKEIVTTLR